ncbi:hypothetical protein [Pontibacter flavimaris]|uniref:Uncharacterized protein n=1 Tax=Pontibacter flavimaris TaxID=1797110 RepID=A0A1Q5P8I1_9BACT|nr:hypothetical protein [Pontibacter flavimaris]OKL38513.1 hypothetical protein A3841_04980 [Pontibacter flavimaris]
MVRFSYRQEVKQNYEQYQALQSALNEYQELLSKSDIGVLEEALWFGEISAVEYFMKPSYYYKACDNFLELKAASQQAAVQLLKYTL